MKPSTVDCSGVSRRIRRLAGQALSSLPPADPARSLALQRRIRPVDYMRCAEYAAVLSRLNLRGGMRVLDMGSPQWLSIHLAAEHPDVEFHYVNIIPGEIDDYRPVVSALDLGNLHYCRQDLRGLAFQANSFDRVLSVSVIEHVHPAEGGDLLALKEARRVLREKGKLLLTVPLKEKAGIVYAEGPVYERTGEGKKFFAREYDENSFTALAGGSFLRPVAVDYICEKRGILALDWYQWGPGREKRLHGGLLAQLLRWWERLFRRSLEGTLARRYLSVVPEVQERVVNVAALLVKEEG